MTRRSVRSVNILAPSAVLRGPWECLYVVILNKEMGGQSVSECKKTAGGKAYITHCFHSLRTFPTISFYTSSHIPPYSHSPLPTKWKKCHPRSQFREYLGVCAIHTFSIHTLLPLPTHIPYNFFLYVFSYTPLLALESVYTAMSIHTQRQH